LHIKFIVSLNYETHSELLASQTKAWLHQNQLAGLSGFWDLGHVLA